MTAPELGALCEQWRSRNRHWETMIAQTAFILYQSNRSTQAQDLKLEDFMLTKLTEAEKATQPQPRRRSIALELESYFTAAKQRAAPRR